MAQSSGKLDRGALERMKRVEIQKMCKVCPTQSFPRLGVIAESRLGLWRKGQHEDRSTHRTPPGHGQVSAMAQSLLLSSMLILPTATQTWRHFTDLLHRDRRPKMPQSPVVYRLVQELRAKLQLFVPAVHRADHLS
jgi:hypothetical protein